MRKIRIGADHLAENEGLFRRRRVGLMTNQTGIDSAFISTIDKLHAMGCLTALFSVEHGIRGNVQAGMGYDVQPDERTGIPVYGVYGNTRRLTPEMLDTFDVLCYDIQDVGARFYTYLYALSYAMEECCRAGKTVVVLDRPNPLGGTRIEGTVLDEKFASYVGMYALPTRYGMTIGEYARWVQHHLHLSDLCLKIIPLEGWHREDGAVGSLPWVAPSPNCPTVHAARIYIGTCIFEGTNLSEGRGTTLPFEYIGAPWVDAYALEQAMNALHLPGLYFRAAYFTPEFSKYAGQCCAGVQIHLTDRSGDAVLGALALLDQIRRLHPGCVEWLRSEEDSNPFTIDKILGTDDYRMGRHDAFSLIQEHAALRTAFEAERKPFLLYE